MEKEKEEQKGRKENKMAVCMKEMGRSKEMLERVKSLVYNLAKVHS